MAEQITVARPYAEAVFALARERNALPVWAEMLRLASDVAGDARVRAALDNPRLSAAAKAEIQQEVYRAKEALRGQVAALAVAGAAKILKREVDAKAHADLLSELQKQL